MSFLSGLPAFTSDWPEHKLLDYAVNHLEWMEQNCNGEEERYALRRIAVEVAYRFGEPGSAFFDDPKMLTVVRIIGKVSRRMGLKGVLKKAYERGQFRKLAEFYVMWAKMDDTLRSGRSLIITAGLSVSDGLKTFKVYAEEGDEMHFNEVWALALTASAQPLSRIDHAFSSMRRQYFPTTIDHPTVNVFGNTTGERENVTGGNTAESNVLLSTTNSNTQHCYSAPGSLIGKQQQEQEVLYATGDEASSSQAQTHSIRHSPRAKENRNGRENKMAIADESLSMEERVATMIGCPISPVPSKNRWSTILLEKTMDLTSSSKSNTTSSRSCQAISETTAISLPFDSLASQKEATVFDDHANTHLSTDYKALEVQPVDGETSVLREVMDNCTRLQSLAETNEQKIKKNEQMVSERTRKHGNGIENVNPSGCQVHYNDRSPADELLISGRTSRVAVAEKKVSKASAIPRELKPPSSFFALPGYSVFKQAPPMKSFPEVLDSFRKKQANNSECINESTTTSNTASARGACSSIISPTPDWGGFRPLPVDCADALFPVPRDEFAGMTGFERRMSLSKKKSTKVVHKCIKEQSLLGCTLKISNEVAQAFSQLNIGKNDVMSDTNKLNEKVDVKINSTCFE